MNFEPRDLTKRSIGFARHLEFGPRAEIAALRRCNLETLKPRGFSHERNSLTD
jgi:hypothetical protein